jgi:hypothetical protein
MCINWDTVWTNVISGIIVGLVVGGFGFLIWKIQYRYSRRKECYTIFRIKLVNYTSLIFAMYKDFGKSDYNNDKVNDLNYSFLENRGTFIYLFGFKYFEPTQKLVDIFTHLKDKEDINMTQDELDKLIDKTLNILENIKI